MYCAEKSDTPPDYSTYARRNYPIGFKEADRQAKNLGEQVNSINKALGNNPKIWTDIRKKGPSHVITPNNDSFPTPDICASVTMLP